jgi:hypothetical protein
MASDALPIGRPAADEYSAFNPAYLTQVPEADVLPSLVRQPGELRQLLAGVDGAREHFRYAEGKWSIRQVVGHLSDVERVFGHRAYAIAKGDPAPLPGFDENAYVGVANFDARLLADLLDEFETVRRGNLFTLRNCSERQWLAAGVANGATVTVRALAFLLVGHVRHHMQILSARYLS